MNLFRRACATLLLLTVVGDACTGDSAATPSSGRGGRGRQSADGLIERTTIPYRENVTTSSAGGSVVGSVSIDGDLPADSITTATADESICGASFPNASVVHTDRALGNVVVWLADVQQGKPLPAERRTELLNERCQLVPHVQGVVVGTTVNVRSDDRLPHTTQLLRSGTADTLARIPLTDDGQVVPNENLATKPGMIEARCVQHPWTRGYIAVFAHPYFAVTDPAGTFRLDSVPPGRYQLIAWHERGTDHMERQVEVKEGEASRVEIQVKLR